MEITDLVYIDDTGYHFADYPSFLQWRQDQYRAIYGADVYLEADSQDGQLLAVQAKADYDTAALGASTYNSFSPVTAQGLGLARNVKINGLTKKVPSFSTVILRVEGTEGTIITNGIATDAIGQKWFLPTPTTIPGAGFINVTATAEFAGAITAEADSVSTIFTPTLGWQLVNNADAATPGAPVESDAELRIRQTQSTANPSQTVFEGTVGAVQNVAGVTKARGYENDTDDPDDNDIPEHSISIVVAGGDDTDIAQAIETRKTPGTGTFGDTTELVYDSHGMPTEISFQRAVTATISAVITISVNQNWSNDFADLIKESVSEFFNAGNIGDTINLTQVYQPAYLVGTAAGTSYVISTVTLQKNSGGFSAADIELDYDENPVSDVSEISVVVT